MVEQPNLIKSMQIPPIKMQKYERYLPTAFDESLSILEKINKVINYLYEYSAITNEMLEKWDVVYYWVMGEGLRQGILDQLNIWLEDGTLSDILEGLLLGEYARKDWVTEQINVLITEIDVFKTKIENDLNDRAINVDTLTGNDSERIQKAMDLTNANGGGRVFIPSRVYSLTEEMVVYQNTTVECANGAILERKHIGYMVLNGDRGASYKRYNGNGNINFIGGIWDSMGHVNSARGSNFAFAHGENITFDNVTFRNATSHHIEINACKNVYFDNCKFLGIVPDVNYIEAIQLDLAFGSAGFNAFGDYDNTACDNVRVNGCYFGASSDLPTMSRGFGSHSTRIGAYHTNVTVENCTFDGGSDYSIQLLSYNNVIIKNNSFFNTRGGIIIYAPRSDAPTHMIDIDGNTTINSQVCSDYLIEGNYFSGVDDKATIYSYGDEKEGYLRRVHITNNVIENISNSNAIIVSRYVKEYMVTMNKTDNVSSIPIALNDFSLNVLISNNMLINSFSSGIRISDICTDFTISNNTISRSGREGLEIYGEGVQKFVISGNIINGTNRRNLDSHGIYIHSGVNTGTITGNNVTSSSGYGYNRALYITNSTQNIIRTGNIYETGVNGISAVSTTVGTELVI